MYFNLLFAHVYTPRTFVYTPPHPNFKFLEITLKLQLFEVTG